MFYYTIPENEAEEREVSELQVAVHSGHARALCTLKRYDECLAQVQMARSIRRNKTECLDTELQALFELQRFEECKTILKNSDDSVKEKWGGKVLEAIREHQVQEKQLYKKMVGATEKPASNK